MSETSTILKVFRALLRDFPDKMLLHAKAVAGLPSPSERDWRSVRDWMFDKMPLVQREQKFILRKDDLVTLN